MPVAEILRELNAEEALFSGSAHRAGVERILQAVRSHLRMDVAFASHVTGTETIIRFCDSGEHSPVRVGDTFPVDDGYCKRILEGRIPAVINDAALVAEVAHLACTRTMPIGAHVSVPLVLSDGSIYGTFCCFSFEAKNTLSDRDVEMMRAFAELAAAQIEAELNLSSRQTLVIEQISSVIERDNLTIVYQPIYRLEDNKVIGVEALSRFPDHERRGPAEWFAEAADFGLGPALELAAVRAALRNLNQLPDDIYLAINVSPELIVSGRLSKLLEGSPPRRIVLEVTEHEIINDLALFQQALAPLRSTVRVAVDDAGAGYSGLRHILDVEPDIIKLDMSLTRNIDKDPARYALATALISFSRKIGSQIVAEGVETAGELQTLQQLGAHSAQGYYLQRPKPIAALSQFLAARRLGGEASQRQGPVGKSENSDGRVAESKRHFATPKVDIR